MFYEKAEEYLQRNLKTLYVELQKQHENKQGKTKTKIIGAPVNPHRIKIDKEVTE